jgi:hypothetical protein
VVSAALIGGQLDWNSSLGLYSAPRLAGYFLFYAEQHSFEDACHRAPNGAVLFSPSLSSLRSSHSLHTMNPSFGFDIRTSLGQSAPPQLPAPSRPHSIAELAERAKQSLCDGVRPLKSWLKIAEKARRDARIFKERGDLELAFVEYEKAATIVLEKIPAHPDYRILLSTTQRHNIGLVSYFYSLGPRTCALAGQVHVPYGFISVFFTVVIYSTSTVIRHSCDACDFH